MQADPRAAAIPTLIISSPHRHDLVPDIRQACFQEEKNQTLKKENRRRLNMKRILTRILMAAGIAGPFVPHVAAQDMIVNIPFTFVANGTTMPAGRYELTQSNASGSVFVLQNVTGRAIFVAFGAREIGQPNTPRITFACYGKECVLAKVAPPASLSAYSSNRASVERSLHRALGISSQVHRRKRY
jgi:hypothetical protein